MAFYRKCKVKITFDMYRIRDTEGNPVNIFLEKFAKDVEYEEDPKYKNRNEAYEIDGTLEEWADKVGKALALDIASKWVGAEVPEDLDRTTVDGNTFDARNIMGEPYDIEEGSLCPEDVELRIQDLLDTIKENEDTIKKYEVEVKGLQEKRDRGEMIDIKLLERYIEYINAERGYIKSYQKEIDRLTKKYCEEE
jgi:hypothetical protein